MDVLLCWSAEKSKSLGHAFHSWLPLVIPSIKPWISTLDINKGRDWFTELESLLNEARAVIVMITSDNVHSPWIYYECGHVAGVRKSNLICPYILDDVTSKLSKTPLGRFQCTSAEKEDTFLLLKSINSSLEEPSEESVLKENFEREWDRFHEKIQQIRCIQTAKDSGEVFVRDQAEDFAGTELNEYERKMILAVGATKDADLLKTVTSHGHQFQAGQIDLNKNETARSTAAWEDALSRLLRLGLMKSVGHKGQVFRMTSKGFRVYDLLAETER